MIQDSYSSREVDQLMQQLRDDDLGPGDEAKLQDIIRNHPVARRRFVRQLSVDAQLKKALEMSKVSLGAEGKSSWLKGWPVVAAVLTAVAAVALPVVMKEAPADPPPSAGGLSPEQENVTTEFEEGIAVMARQPDVVWKMEDPDAATERDERIILSPGIIVVESGVLRVDFYNGASVFLQGPTRFEVVAGDVGRLYSGSVTAEVPSPALGFRIESSKYEVVDLGTYFAMKVRQDGAREVHVFDGEVSIQDEVDRELTLIKGEAAILKGSQIEPVRIKARPSDFPSAKSLSLAVESRRLEWGKLRDLLKQDPDVLLYYTFEKGLNWAHSIPNEAMKATEESDGAVVGCRVVEGRWPGKTALGFNNSSNRVRVNLPGEYETLSLATWVKVDQLHSNSISLLNPETDQDRYIHWNLTGTLEPDEKGFKTWSTHFADTIVQLGVPAGREHYYGYTNLHDLLVEREWVHLGLVYDPVKEEVRHYANGMRTHTNKISALRPLKIGVADIGNWPFKEWAEGTRFEVRYLKGAMDEFLIAKRAFSDSEIRQMYEVGKP